MPHNDQINGNEIADSIFINGRIYTVDQNRSWAEAVAVKNGRFTAVGSTSVVSEQIGPATETVDLDAIVTDRPVSLMSEDGHCDWVNSMALAMAGITKDTVSPKGGIIEKDVLTGIPSGTIRETARDLIQNVLPPFSVEQIKGSIQNFMIAAGRVGITTAHDPLMILPDARGQLNGFGANRHNIQAYSEMAQDGDLTIRIRGTVLTDPTAQASQIQRMVSACAQRTDPLFQLTGIKVFVNGAVEGGTAFLLEPYAHMPHTCGEPLWESENLKDLFATADLEKLQIHIHAIGDAAIRMALDAFEHARARNDKRDSRHLIIPQRIDQNWG